MVKSITFLPDLNVHVITQDQDYTVHNRTTVFHYPSLVSENTRETQRHIPQWRIPSASTPATTLTNSLTHCLETGREGNLI